MEDGKPNKGDTEGKKPDNDPTEDKVDATPAEKVRKDTEELKAENDAYDKEKFRAETIRAERAVGGKSDAGQEEMKTPEELKEAEAKDRVNRIGKAMGAEWANKKD